MIITGINLGIFEYNLFPFFHSGQSKVGFNLAKLKDVNLDVLLEELKSRQVEESRLIVLKKQILDILKKEAVIKTLYSPYTTVFIDRNLKNTLESERLPYAQYAFDVIKPAHIKEARSLNITNKTLFGLIAWIRTHLF